MSSPLRAAIYVDGFNLYCAIKEYQCGQSDKGFLYPYIWLDIQWLCKRILRHRTAGTELLSQVRYFTTIPTHIKDKALRHSTYISAIKQHTPYVDINIGEFIHSYADCKIIDCGKRFRRWQEKKSDVQLAVSIINDAHSGAFDCAYILSADSDHIPVIEMVQSNFPKLKIGAWFPPNRFRKNIYNAAKGMAYEIDANDIKVCQFPLSIKVSDTAKIDKPLTWR